MTRIAFIGVAETLPATQPANTGNFIHGYAARSLFTDRFNTSRNTNPGHIERLRAEATHLGFVAATMLHVSGAPSYADSHREAADFIERLGLPVVTFGFGCQGTLGASVAEAEVDPRSVRLLRVIADHAEQVAVRGEFTADLARKYGVTNAVPIGCQSIYFATAGMGPLDLAHRDVYRRYAANLTTSLDETRMIRLLMAQGVDFIGQNDPVETGIARGETSKKDFVGSFRKSRISSATRSAIKERTIPPGDYFRWIRHHYHKFHTVPEWIWHMRFNYDFAFGSRFHGNTAAVMAGLPALWFVHDIRTQELCAHFALPSMPFEEAQEATSVEDLRARCDFGPFFAQRDARRAEFEAYLKANGVLDIVNPALF